MAFTVRFWGTRGTVATPGASTLRYGGNTCCVEVRCAGQVIVLDAGTGVRALGVALEREGAEPISLVFSHTHMDHIQGFPFFLPAYHLKKNLVVYEPPGLSLPVQEALRKQTEPYYFPVPLNDLPAHLEFRKIEKQAWIGEVLVRQMELNHPGGCSGYRVEHGGKALVYLTDHEPYTRLFGETGYSVEKDGEVLDFMRGGDLVIRDTTYTVEEYDGRRGWGHGTFDDAAMDAKRADVKCTAAFHHDPDHSDDTLEAALAAARAAYSLGESRLILSREGQTLTL